jgi:hypothetical protein
MCINNFETSALGIWEYVKLYFANSKECGVNPGSHQTELFGYPVDTVQPDTGTAPTTKPGDKPIPADNTGPNKAVSSVNSASVATSGTTSSPTSTTPPPPSAKSGVSSSSSIGSASAGSTTSSDSKIASSMIVNPNPNGGLNNDPCFDWSTYNGGTVSSPPVTSMAASAGASTSSTSSSPEMSSKMIAPMYSDEYYKEQIENKKFCPNLIGKDLTEWENVVNSYSLYQDILDVVPSLTNMINDVYNCIHEKSTSAEILKYLKGDYSKAYVNRNLINDMKYQISDKSSQDYAKILNLDSNIKRLGDSYGSGDFNLVCSNETCKCLDCPTPINFTFTYSRFDSYTPQTGAGGNLEEDMYKPSAPTAFNIYISRCDNKIIYFLIENEQYSSAPTIDIKLLHPSIPTTTGLNSIVDLQNLAIQQCMVQDLKNTSSQCPNSTFNGINATCKSKFSNKCANLSNTVSQFSPDRVGFRACDITSVNVMDGSIYESFKKTCFEWINNSFIDGSLTLNLSALTNILTVIKNGQNPKSLRFLQPGVLLNVSKIVNSDAVDNDKTADVSGEASTGSNGTLDVDGSSYSAFYGGIMYAKAGDAAVSMSGTMAATAPTTSMEASTSANAQNIPRDVGPPRLSSSSWMTLSCFVYVFILAFLF